MGFEWIGRLAMRPLGILFSVLTCCIPLAAALFMQQNQYALEKLEEKIFLARKRAKVAFERKERTEKFLAHHTNPDPYFLDKEIESIQFLEKEKALLAQWASHPAMNFQSEYAKPKGWAESQENRLRFTEEKIQTGPFCKETLEIQRHPVQMNEEDLKKLLSLVEEIPSHLKSRPQLLITDFHLAPKNGLLEIQMNLFKREILSP